MTAEQEAALNLRLAVENSNHTGVVADAFRKALENKVEAPKSAK